MSGSCNNEIKMVYPLSRRIPWTYLKLYLKEVNGAENLPKKGPFVIASNQQSHCDLLLLPTVIVSKLNKKIYFITRFEIDKNRHGLPSKIILSIFKPLFVRWLGCVPISNKGGTINICVNLLNKGGIVGIFPEGKRNLGKTLLRARTGVARMALLSKVPVVPVGILDSHKVLPIGAKFPRFKRAVINIGKPMYFEKYYDEPDNRRVLDKVAGKIMVEIGNLCGKRSTKQ